MRITNWNNDNAGETATDQHDSGQSTGFERMKNGIADTLHNVAEGLGEKAAEQDAQAGMAQYGQHASEWLNQSAEYVRQFDAKQADARVREYVRQNPGRSLLIAGGVGLMIGVILRRR